MYEKSESFHAVLVCTWKVCTALAPVCAAVACGLLAELKSSPSPRISQCDAVRLVASKINWPDINSDSVMGRGSPGGPGGKESSRNAGDLGSIPGSGKFPGDGNGDPLQYVCLGNPMARGTWWVTVYRAAKSWTRQSDHHYHFLSCTSHQFSSVQSLSCVRLFVTPWTAAAIALSKLFSVDVLWFPSQNMGVVTVLVLQSCCWFTSMHELTEY